MKCKFEHGGDCCNSGSPQYMCKCKPDVCNSEVAMTNADRIRSMSDEELAYFICSNFECKFCPISHIEDIWLEAVCDAQHGHEIEKLVEWLQQPAKEG